MLEKQHPLPGAIRVVHRLGEVPRGEAAIYVGIQSKHREEGFRFLQEFMDELKKDVPILETGMISVTIEAQRQIEQRVTALGD